MNIKYILPPLVFLLALLLAACGGAGQPAPPSTSAPAAQGETPSASVVVETPATGQPADQPTSTPVRISVATSTPSPEPTDQPAVEAQGRATEEPTSQPSDEITDPSEPLPPVANVLNGANLRAGPGTGFAVVGEIEAGQQVFVGAQNPAGDWIQLNMEGPDQTWIAAFLLDLPAGLDLPVVSDIPAPPPTPTPGDFVVIQETKASLSTYPWRQFTEPAFDEATQWSYQRFNRSAYEASNPQPSPQSYRLVSLENQWLRLTLLPDLGGRLYQMIFKPTGSNELYQNPVIKPSPWGPGEQGNGWVGAGGIEWGLPVAEHGYAWGESWGYITDPSPPAGQVTVFDKNQERFHLFVDVGLQPDSAAFSLDFTLDNLGETPVDASYWTNAMLAPGPTNRVGPDLRFLFPGSQMRVHSTGEDDLPGEGDTFDWPVYNGRDVSRLGTWRHWLGFFVHPQAQADWAAVYDTSVDEGVVRIFPRQQTPGLKGFGLGDIWPGNYTDDDSSYVELQGGIAPTFWDTVHFESGASRQWREIWYPVAGIGGITAADRNGAVHLTRENDGLRLRIFSTRTRSGELVASNAQGEIIRITITIDPAHPFDTLLPTDQAPINSQLLSTDGVWQMDNLFPD